MRPNPPDLWSTLVRRAARVPDTRDTEMPLGFDTRVLAHRRDHALDLQSESELLLFLRRLTWLGCSLVALSIALNLRSLRLDTTATSTVENPDVLTAALFPE